MQNLWCVSGFGLLVEPFPLFSETRYVVSDLLFRRTLCGSPDDDARPLGQRVLQELLKTRALAIGKATTDAGHRSTRHVHEVASGQRNLARQAGTFVSDRVLGHLHEDRITGLHGQFDALRLTFKSGRIPVDFTGIQHRVAATTDVDKRRFHRGQNVLHAAEVDVAHHRR